MGIWEAPLGIPGVGAMCISSQMVEVTQRSPAGQFSLSLVILALQAFVSFFCWHNELECFQFRGRTC